MEREDHDLVVAEDAQLPADIDTNKLKVEASTLINQIIAEDNAEKTKDLTYLFNQNQAKKTIVRVNKCNDIQELMVDQLMARMTTRPDEIDNATLMQGLKTVQDIIERGQKQVNGNTEQMPMIQINQQNNEINVGGEQGLSKESRDKVNKFVMAVLGKAAKNNDAAEVNNDIVEEPIDGNS